MDRETACFFTGHRAFPKNDELLKRLYYEIEKKINEGVCDFIAGGALGFDTVCAKAVINLKSKYSQIRLHLYLPCYDQMKKWSAYDSYIGRLIMSKADEKLYVTEGFYTPQCMHKRNRKMAEDAKYCIAYCTNLHSGTAKTIDMAYEFGDEVINIAN